MKKTLLMLALVAGIASFAQNAPAGLVTSSDNFGTPGNTFTIDFVGIGDTNNVVPYEYRMGTYEISQNVIDKATASGMANVTAGAYGGNQPAANITWYEGAAFVNWLNTSTGKTAAYDLAWNGSSWSMNLWSSGQAWTAGGTNLYRNKDAFYFLPSEGEWYKAAYYNPAGSNYFTYPTASSSVPTAVASGTNAGTAVFGNVASVPAAVNSAGGLSPYGTMGQGGNIWEFLESAYDGVNNSPSENRAFNGGYFAESEYWMRSSSRSLLRPDFGNGGIGFRVASGPVAVPEPGTWAAAALLVGGAAFMRWRKRAKVA